MAGRPILGMTNGTRREGEFNEPTRALIAATVALAKKKNASSKRHTPSPSSVDYCTRRNWFSETGVAPTNDPDPESFISAESGRMTESLISEIINESGLGRVEPLTDEERELLPAQYRRLHLRGGQFDQMLVTTNSVTGKDQDVMLLEYKRKGAFNILDLHRKGIREANPQEYQQMQLLMAGTGLSRCLYVAVNWDRGALTSSSKSWATRPSGIYAEWVEAVPIAVVAATQRAAMQEKYILTVKSAIKVPRDHEPFGGAKADWQCRFCAWRDACLVAEGGKATGLPVGVT